MELLQKFPAIKKCEDFSREKLNALKSAVSEIDMKGANLVANGSYARKEASTESDFDYLVIFPKAASDQDKEATSKNLRNIVERVIGKLPSHDGVFAAPIEVGELTKDIGGQEDTNEDITHRILFLSEGLPVCGRSLFDEQRSQLIERYVQDTINDHQLALFFLNDVIRYWRTICVDFENKTFEKGKDWGIRNVKLVFSRRLLYFGGILIAAETAHHTASEKREIFSQLADLSPLQRLVHVCGPACERALHEYDDFLEKMMDHSFRSSLLGITKEQKTQTEPFRRLKNKGHHFGLHLLSALQSTYSASHPIHRSLIM
jgi:hypothetical protein